MAGERRQEGEGRKRGRRNRKGSARENEEEKAMSYEGIRGKEG